MQNNKVFRIDDDYEFLTKELLEREYVQNKLTDKQIAEKYNIGSKATVWRRRKFHNISNSCQNKSNKNAQKNRKFIVSKEDALKWQVEGKTYNEMASMVGCSKMVLYRRIKELGVVTERKEEMKKLKWHEPISDIQNRFLLGDLLGDGNITSWGMYQCNHSYKQKSYIEYKQNILINLMSPSFNLKEHIVHNHQNGKDYRAYYLRTMGNKILKDIYGKFYIDKVKVFSYDYLMKSDFDAYSLAIWYMDDGSRKNDNCAIYTYGFGYCGNLKILDFLYNKFNLIPIISQDNSEKRGDDSRNYISFNVSESEKFFSIVAPHILPSFQYKLPRRFRK